jgi:hypothetical protein
MQFLQTEGGRTKHSKASGLRATADNNRRHTRKRLRQDKPGRHWIAHQNLQRRRLGRMDEGQPPRHCETFLALAERTREGKRPALDRMDTSRQGREQNHTAGRPTEQR